MTFYFYGSNYKEGKRTVPQLENSHRICPSHAEDLAVRLACSFQTRPRPSVTTRGRGQRLAAHSELCGQTAFPSGNA